MKVASILHRKGTGVITIGPEMNIKLASHKLTTEDISALVVVQNGRIAGILSERDIARGLARHGEALTQMRARDLMTEHVITCEPEDSLKHIMTLMTHHRVRHLPVVNDGALAGIVSIGDVVKYRLEELELETNVLRDAYFASH